MQAHLGRQQLLIITGLTLLAFALRMVWIDHPKLWADEVFSYLYSRHSFAHHFDLHRTSDVHPPLHPVTLKVAIALFGENRAAMRGVSALFGALAIPALYLIARHWLSVRVAIFAAIFLALNPLQIHFGREARTYAMLSFFLLWATFFFLEIVRRPTVDRRAFYNGGLFALCLALTFHLHYTAITFAFLFGVATFGLLLSGLDRQRVALLIGALAFAALLCLPQSIHMFGYSLQAGASRNAWIEPTNWHVFYANTLGAYPFPAIAKPLIFGLYAYGAYELWKRSARLFLVTMVFLIGGPLLFAAIGLIKPIYLVRSIQCFVLLSPLLLAVAIARFSDRIAIPVLALLIVVHLWAARDDYPRERQPNIGEILRARPFHEPFRTVFFDSYLVSEDNPEIAAYKVDTHNWRPVALKSAPQGLMEIEQYLSTCGVATPRCKGATVIIEAHPLFAREAGVAWQDGLDRIKQRYAAASDQVQAGFRIITFK